MSGGGSKSSGSTYQVNTTQLPAWVEGASQSNYNLAKDIANKPYTPYEGQRVAGFTPDQNAAQDYLRANTGAYQPVYDTALQGLYQAGTYQPQQVQSPYLNYNYTPQDVSAQQVSYNYSPQNVSAQQISAQQVGYNYTPDKVQAQQVNYTYNPKDISAERVSYNYTPEQIAAQKFTDANIDDYMNPYIQNVENRAIDNLERSRQIATNQIGDAAAAAKSYGGSRQAILEGVQAAETARASGDLSAQLRADAYNNAAGLIQGDQNRALQAAQANQAAGLQASQYGLQAGMANASNALAASQANQQAGLQNAGLGLQAQGMNQDAALRAAMANQGAGLQASQYGLQAGIANQNAALQAAQSNQSSSLQAGLANQNAGLQNAYYGLQAQGMNQNAALQAALANQSAGLQNAQYGLQAGMANQSAAMQAALANQSAGLNANQQLIQSALGGAQVAGAGQDAFTRDYSLLLNQGALQQDQNQRYLDDAYAQYMQAQNYDLERLGVLQSALGMSPYGSTTTGYGTSTQKTSQQGFNPLGLALGIGSLPVSGGGSLAGNLLSSDDRLKTDVQKVGETDEGLGLYAFRYRGDPKSYPKSVGLMASEVEKAHPEAVTTLPGKDGMRAVDYGKAAPKGLLARGEPQPARKPKKHKPKLKKAA